MSNTTFEEIGRVLREHQQFVVLGHVRPDGDALGSQLALGLSLQKLGKNVRIWNEEGMLEKYSFLPRAELLTKPPATAEHVDVAIALDTAIQNRLGTMLAAVESAVSHSSARRTANDVLAAQWRAIGGLTSREAEVCALVARGRLNKQIAATIGTTEKTVKVHRARALQKLGIKSVAELVHMLDAVLGVGADEHPVDGQNRPLERPLTLEIIAKHFVGD